MSENITIQNFNGFLNCAMEDILKAVSDWYSSYFVIPGICRFSGVWLFYKKDTVLTDWIYNAEGRD